MPRAMPCGADGLQLGLDALADAGKEVHLMSIQQIVDGLGKVFDEARGPLERADLEEVVTRDPLKRRDFAQDSGILFVIHR